MRAAGRVVAEMHAAIRELAAPGVSTAALDAAARRVIDRRGARASFLGYHGYPAVICASVNDEVIHGIPGERVLLDGDVLSVDCGAIVDGWHGDAAFTIGIGTVSATARRLIDAAEAALAAGIDSARVGLRLGDVGSAIGAVVSSGGFGSPRQFCGHGIGREMHEDPDVENRGKRGRGLALEAGMVLAIEPMLLASGRDEVRELDDGWTIVTTDGSVAAHVEHTVAITDDGPQILTLL